MTISATLRKWFRRGCQLAAIGLVLAACDEGTEFAGRVIETRGHCHTIMGKPDPVTKKAIRYAVHAGALGTIKAGTDIVIVGHVSPDQDCAAAVVLDVISVRVQ